MEEKRKELEEWIEKKGIRKWFRKDNLIVLILSGILLLIIAIPTREPEGNRKSVLPGKESAQSSLSRQESAGAAGKSSTKGSGWMSGTGAGGIQSTGTAGTEQYGAAEQEAAGRMEEYTAEMEKKLSGILGGMEGVGKVQVMITLQSSEELIVEKDQPMNRSNTTETDAKGGNRTVYQTDSGEETVYRSAGSDSEPYVVKTLTPRVEGVMVVAQGAGTADVNKNISEAVQALFGIEAHRVKVVKMES